MWFTACIELVIFGILLRHAELTRLFDFGMTFKKRITVARTNKAVHSWSRATTVYKLVLCILGGDVLLDARVIS